MQSVLERFINDHSDSITDAILAHLVQDMVQELNSTDETVPTSASGYVNMNFSPLMIS